MEKENRKAREDARKDYNDTVKAGYPPRQSTARYKAHLKAQSLPPVALSLRSPPARQADGELTTVYVEQEWQKTSVSGAEDLEWALAEGNDDPEVFECVVCGKSFKSEAAWNSHERSKKHIKNVEVLRRQMEEEGTEFGLPANPSDELGFEPAEGGRQPGDLATPPVDNGSDTEHEAPSKTEESQEFQAQKGSAEETLPEDSGENERILPREQNLSKRDKRRLREAQKQAQAVEDAHKCYVCEAKFESRSGLFDHIRGSGHAIAKPTTDTSTKTKGKRGKR